MKKATVFLIVLASALWSSSVGLAQLSQHQGEVAQHAFAVPADERPDGATDAVTSGQADGDTGAPHDHVGISSQGPTQDWVCNCYLNGDCPYRKWASELGLTRWCRNLWFQWPCGCDVAQLHGDCADPLASDPYPQHDCVPEMPQPEPGCSGPLCVDGPLIGPVAGYSQSGRTQSGLCESDCLLHPLRPSGPGGAGAFPVVTDQ